MSLGINFITGSGGSRSLPLSLASFAQPVHVEISDPDMKWDNERFTGSPRYEEADHELGPVGANGIHAPTEETDGRGSGGV